ncbi:MAG TPA: hypothetical protein VFB59_00025 [Candidatus Saccharimonadales bacterium]|nr:hypothetical protein [Candidatus Saccharimonadales bacterium]
MAKREKSDKQKRQQPPQQAQIPLHQHKIVVWLVPLLIILVLFLGWWVWRPLIGWLEDFRPATTRQNAEPVSTTERAKISSGVADGTEQQPQVTVNTSGGSGGSGSPSGSGGSGGNTGSGGGGTNTDLAQLYKEIESGDTYSEVRNLVGDPDDCIQTLLGALGVQKVCTWYDGSSSMVVTFIDDNAVSKTDIGL